MEAAVLRVGQQQRRTVTTTPTHTHTTDTGRGNNTNEANIQAALRLTRALYPHLLDDTGAADVTRCCIQQV